MDNVFEGLRGGKRKRLTSSLLLERDLNKRLMGMSLGAVYPAGIVARMIARGDISTPGLLSPMMDIPHDRFMAAQAEKGVVLKETIEDPD